jgi:hypothetical protein
MDGRVLRYLAHFWTRGYLTAVDWKQGDIFVLTCMHSTEKAGLSLKFMTRIQEVISSNLAGTLSIRRFFIVCLVPQGKCQESTSNLIMTVPLHTFPGTIH